MGHHDDDTAKNKNTTIKLIEGLMYVSGNIHIY